eukprot:1328168-Rhodomonas_salina.1
MRLHGQGVAGLAENLQQLVVGQEVEASKACPLGFEVLSIRSELQSESGSGFLNASAVNLRQLRSTVWNRLASVGSCFWMSSDAKIGSRYIQLRWHASHCSRMSDASFRPCSHASRRSSKGFLYGENVMACVITMWSSSSWKISSQPPMT